MTLTLITGAGASRMLGYSPMPLMADWASVLREHLSEQEPGLAEAAGLGQDMDGPAFEETLGAILEWSRVRERLEPRFHVLGASGFSTAQQPKVRAHHELLTQRLRSIQVAVNETLYDLFGQDKVDAERAEVAYRQLLEVLKDADLIIATTNYDRSAETGLHALGHRVSTGFHGKYGATPILEPAGMVEDRAQRGTPVIHLHGAVGWYRAESGEVRDHLGSGRYNPTLGTPVVLYPDPDKDPTDGTLVTQLWDEFDAALSASDRVLVLGHSLHDAPLVDRLTEFSRKLPRGLQVAYRGRTSKDRFRKLLPDARVVALDFDPPLTLGSSTIRALRGGS